MGPSRLTRVLLDTSACIYFLDGRADDPRHRAVADLVQRVDRGETAIVLSPITVAELLVLPIRTAEFEAEAMVRPFASRLCEVAPASEKTASLAASIRSTHRLRLPNAFVVAASLERSVDGVVGNDEAWKRGTQIRYPTSTTTLTTTLTGSARRRSSCQERRVHAGLPVRSGGRAWRRTDRCGR